MSIDALSATFTSADPWPPPQHPGSEQPTNPSIRYAAAHVTPSNLFSPVNRLNFLVHSSSVTGRSAFSRTAWACLLLTNERYQKTESMRVRNPLPIRGPVLKVSPSCLSLSQTQWLLDMHKDAKYAFFFKIAKTYVRTWQLNSTSTSAAVLTEIFGWRALSVGPITLLRML